MKHVFYLCQNAFDELGLENVLSFYNIISLENSDSVEDATNKAVNIFVAKDFADKDFNKFVQDLSYGEKPYIISSSSTATVKLSELYDWEIHTQNDTAQSLSANETFLLRFNIFVKDENKIFGNIHKLVMKDFGEYMAEVMDWSENFSQRVSEILNQIVGLIEGMNVVECELVDEKLVVKNVFFQNIPAGSNVFLQAQVQQNESPFFLKTMFNDVTTEDVLNFHDGFKIENPISQNKSYPLSQILIKSKYEKVVKNNFPIGVWKYGGDNIGKIDQMCIATYPIDEDGDKTLCLLHRGYNIYDIDQNEGFIICTREKGIQLTGGDVFGEIRSTTTVLDNNNNLIGWVNEVIKAIIHYQMQGGTQSEF